MAEPNPTATREPGDSPVEPPVEAGRGPRVGVRSLWPYLRAHRATLALVGLLSLAAAAAALATPLLTRRLLDGLGAGERVAGTLALLVAAVVVGALLDGLVRFLLDRTAEGVVRQTRVRLAGHLLRLPIAEIDRRRTGDLISRIGADTTQLSAVVTSGLVELASGLVVIVGAVVLMARLDPLMLAVTVAATGIGVVGVGLAALRIRPLSEQAQAAVGAMTAGVERVLGAVRTVRASGAEQRETQVVAHQADEAYRAGVRVAKVQAVIQPLASIAVQVAFLAVLGVGGARVATGSSTVGDLVAFVLLLFLLVQPLAQAISAWTSIQTGLGALARIEEIVAVPAEDDGDSVTRPRAVAGAALLAFDAVSFAYPDGTVVLHDVTFDVPRGSRVALVGPSGAGKSTLLALAERFYDPTGGRVLIDGTDVRDWPRRMLRARMGYVEQDAPVLAGTLRENLLLVDPTADESRLRAVLDQVNLGDVATRSPLGLEAPVGDEGVLLSGGERQRLAIARVLLASPELLLLDEPTSALDARNEAALRDAVDAVAAQRTLVVVAHRLSTVVDADTIVVLDRGRVVAIGPHAELLQSSPLYREFASQQLLV